MDTILNFIGSLYRNGWASCLCLIGTVGFAIIWFAVISVWHKKDRIVTPIRILFVGTYVSAVIYFLPLMQEIISEQGGRGFWWDSIFTSMQFAFRLFILDGEILWILDEELSVFEPDGVKGFYTLIGSILYVLAPIFTFSFVLTFFNNLFAKLHYFFAGLCHTHVFNELNEKSVALATDLKKQSFWNAIVFTEISDKVLEEKMELVEDARMLGAVLFSKDFDSINFKWKRSPRRLYFYLISEDEQKKLRHAEIIMHNYDYNNVELRLFSPFVRSELLLASLSPQHMRAIRIDDIQTLVYHNLYTHGRMLFKRARKVSDNDKVISAVIVGLGQYGREMVKALSWFCQLDGYNIKITAFDSDEDAEEKFKYMCPELMDDKYNGKHIQGEPYYEIRIVGGIDVSTPNFRNQLEEIKDASYIFVCLGNDEINLKTSVEIRSMCESIDYGKNEHKPDIETVIYDSNLAYRIRTTWEHIEADIEGGVIHQDNNPYNILVTGYLESFYSVSTLIDSDLITEGLLIHLGYFLPSASKNEKEGKLEFKCSDDKGVCNCRQFMIDNAHKQQNYFVCPKENEDKCISSPPKKEDEKKECEPCKKIAEEIANNPEKTTRSRKKKSIIDEFIDSRLVGLCPECKKKAFNREDVELKFWRYEYNYDSSIAKAIHRNLRKEMGVYSESDENWENLCCRKKIEQANPEHIRWMAYMRAKGFVKTEHYLKSERNILGKRHHCLIPTQMLNDRDLEKD